MKKKENFLNKNKIIFKLKEKKKKKKKKNNNNLSSKQFVLH